ncbi:hypothetical protein K503DRAFT_776084 [Rhizopogon vinicolor AM-OR11-026]|uniref:Uncharacterized protein n=1 Tax=Rhizopogon vinicolor AM-OR11-026 TaxID=1314800 RepID=A0A1B7MK68_9AGAM|nr:hypothetical protein K503DRAFT_776084 [Rhizopogon vinicolor AM-OR11-026]
MHLPAKQTNILLAHNSHCVSTLVLGKIPLKCVSHWRPSHRLLGTMSVVGDREHPVSSRAPEHSDAFSKLSGAR